jgi:hypothetical protein
LLTADEREIWPAGGLRTAFAIGSGRALTAWHCIRDIGGTDAHVWLRLRRKGNILLFADIPLRYERHAESLDMALLIIDDASPYMRNDELTEEESRELLDSVALPLGILVEAHDTVRVAGFPQDNPAEWCVMFSGEVSQVDTMIGQANATRLYVRQFAARIPESPMGMSGGPVLRKGPDGRERVIAIISGFPHSSNDQIALGGEALCRRIAHLVDIFPPIAELLQSSAPRPDSTEGIQAGILPMLALSGDVQEAYRQTLDAIDGASAITRAWTLDELTELQHRATANGQGASKTADTLTALREALIAKPIFLAVGGSEVQLGQLQVTYRREIGAWPDGSSADALLVEAANVTIAERRTETSLPLSALARFLIGVAALLRVPPKQGSAMAHWISSLGHQLADAQEHYAQRRDDPAWLLIDLGDEPRAGAATPWPTTVTWTRFTRDDDPVGGSIRCEPTADGLRRALSAVLQLIPPARPLLVDLAVPRALMDEGIEHWPIIEVDGEAEALSVDCSPRLRWSRRRRDVRLFNRLLDRMEQASWKGDVKQWLRNDPRYACFLGGSDVQAPTDPLRVLLRDGCGFVIWFPGGLPASAVRKISKSVRRVPVSARILVLPDHLPIFNEERPVIIWDDPRGRGEFHLPPPVMPESP